MAKQDDFINSLRKEFEPRTTEVCQCQRGSECHHSHDCHEDKNFVVKRGELELGLCVGCLEIGDILIAIITPEWSK